MAIKLKDETYLSPAEAAEFTNRAIQTIYQRWKSWEWKPYHFGNRLLFKQSDIEDWLESQIMEGSVLER